MESNKSTFDQDIRESELLFKDQFNPDSIHFHNGDPTPVPVGGQRIPNSMPTVFNPNPEPAIEKCVNYGPEYDQIFAKREFFSELKKTLAKLTPPIEAILRHKEVFASKANPNDAGHLAKLKKNIDIEKEKIMLVIKELQSSAEIIKEFHEYKESYYLNLKKIIDNGLLDYQDKEQFTTYAFEVKNYSKDVFKEMAVLLEKMKAIKKAIEGKSSANNAKSEKKEIIEKKNEEAKTE